LHPWGMARARTVLVRLGHRLTLTPDRARCGSCRVGQTLLPARSGAATAATPPRRRQHGCLADPHTLRDAP
jgi:hypothetical protein